MPLVYQPFENISPDTVYELFKDAFNLSVDNPTDPLFQKICQQVVIFVTERPDWQLMIEEGEVDLLRFRASVRARIAKSKILTHNEWALFMDRYGEKLPKRLAFEVEPEDRIVRLTDYITRRVVLMRREILPMEIHDYKNYPIPFLGWLILAQKIIDQNEDLSAEEVKQFSAGLTHYRDLMVNLSDGDNSAQPSYSLEGQIIDLRQALSVFYNDYEQDTRIDDELKEVEFFLSRFDLPHEYFTEVVDFFCKIETFYRGYYRKSDKSKRSIEKLAPEFTHILYVFRLAFGGLEVAEHYPNLLPASAQSFWAQLKSRNRLLSLAFRVGAHDILEDEKKLNITGLSHILQSFYVRLVERLFPYEERASWVDNETKALRRLNAKEEREPSYKGQTQYSAYIEALLEHGEVSDVYLKMCDNLHNQTSQIPNNYKEGAASDRYIQKIKDTEPLVDKALEVGFYWLMPMKTLNRVFMANGQALLTHSHAWRTVYTEIYLPRGGSQAQAPEA